MRLGLLASGDLGAYVLKHLISEHDVVFIMTDQNSTSILQLIHANQILHFIGNPRSGKCQSFIKDKIIDVLISVNYLFLIERDLIDLPVKLAFNIHGSLLPKYRGRTPHVWAIINNETETGITAHVIDNGCDTGDIIEQIKVPITKNDTGATILEKYRKLYLPIIQNVLRSIENDCLILTPQEHPKATYFNKRTSGDGHINWDWQRERIFNWVRAQAHPYPGAFTFYNEHKLIVHEVSFDDSGYNSSMTNGLILTSDPILVKTPNGVLRLSKIDEHNFQIKSGNILQ